MTHSWNNDHHRAGRSRLYRYPENGVLMGVCAGLADHFGISVVGVRIAAFLGLVFFFVPVLAAYLIMGFFLKPKPPGLYKSEEEADFWRRTRVDPKRTVSDIQQRFREIERRIRNAEAYVTSSEFKLKRDFKEI